MVLAEGSRWYGSKEGEEGSNLKGSVPGRPVVEVAAWLIWRASRRGIRKVEVQPAPRIRMEVCLSCVWGGVSGGREVTGIG